MHEGQVIAEALRELLQWLRENKHAATKEDLREAEARIIAAIKGSQSSDQKRLDTIVEKVTNLATRITAIAKTLAQLDASTT